MTDLADLENLFRIAPGAIERYIGPALFVAGNRVQVAAQNSITEGAVSGDNHVASEAPSAPNNDTGVLANNIETVQVNQLKVEVSSSAPYAAIQEFGGTVEHDGRTVVLPARPYMEPAANKERRAANALVQRAVKLGVRYARGSR